MLASVITLFERENLSAFFHSMQMIHFIEMVKIIIERTLYKNI